MTIAQLSIIFFFIKLKTNLSKVKTQLESGIKQVNIFFLRKKP
jgi:hypothetical protein